MQKRINFLMPLLYMRSRLRRQITKLSHRFPWVASMWWRGIVSGLLASMPCCRPERWHWANPSLGDDKSIFIDQEQVERGLEYGGGGGHEHDDEHVDKPHGQRHCDQHANEHHFVHNHHHQGQGIQQIDSQSNLMTTAHKYGYSSHGYCQDCGQEHELEQVDSNQLCSSTDCQCNMIQHYHPPADYYVHSSEDNSTLVDTDYGKTRTILPPLPPPPHSLSYDVDSSFRLFACDPPPRPQPKEQKKNPLTVSILNDHGEMVVVELDDDDDDDFAGDDIEDDFYYDYDEDEDEVTDEEMDELEQHAINSMHCSPR